jgi:signal transduction histidine kinase
VLHFSVADTGIGIPHDRQAAIFEVFTKLMARPRGNTAEPALAFRSAHDLQSPWAA